MTLDEKKDIMTNLEEIWRIIREINNVKVPNILKICEENTNGINENKDGIRRLDNVKLDKMTFEEFMIQFKDMKNKFNALSDKIKALKDHTEDIQNLMNLLKQLEDRFNEFISQTDDNFNKVNTELKKKCTFDSLEDLKNWAIGELEDLKEQFERKLETKADKDWVSKMIKKLQEMIEKVV